MHFIFKIFYWFSKKVLPWYLKILIMPFPNQNSNFPSLCLPKILICAILWFLKLWFAFSKIMICILTYISNFNFFLQKLCLFSLKIMIFHFKIFYIVPKKNLFFFFKILILLSKLWFVSLKNIDFLP